VYGIYCKELVDKTLGEPLSIRITVRFPTLWITGIKEEWTWGDITLLG
jgi:hypothetical protein